MLCIGRRKLPVVIGAFSMLELFDRGYDKPTETSLPTSNIEEETGLDRLNRMFSRNEDLNLSPELQNILRLSWGGMFAGFIIGGIAQSRFVVSDFVEQNQATKFAHRYNAQRAVQDLVLLKFVKGGILYGLKVGSFIGIFTTASTMMTVYRGKAAIRDYAFAGGISGLIFKASMGLRGAMVGTLLGSTLGLVAGTAVYGLLALRGFVPEPKRDFVKEYKLLNEARKKEEALKNNEQPSAKDLFEANRLMADDIKHALKTETQQE